MLSVSNLSRSFGGRTILDSISFVINPGDRVGLIGPNGAGKSTLLRMIAGFDRPDRGSVSVSPGERIGMLRQGFADIADGTLADLLDGPTNGLASASRELERTLARSDGSDEMVDPHTTRPSRTSTPSAATRPWPSSMLGAFGLENVRGTPLSELSGGEKTRPAGRADHLPPRLPVARRADESPRRRGSAIPRRDPAPIPEAAS